MTELLPTLLFIDDDPFILKAVTTLLADFPARILTTDDPVAVFPLIAAEGVAVLVSDIQMPRRDGVDLMIEARARHPEVVRVLMSTTTDFQSALRAMNQGEVFRFVTKPLDGAALREALTAAVGHARTSRRELAARRATDRRVRELGVLEARYPGLGRFDLPDGAYRLPENRPAVLASRLAGSPLLALLGR